MPGAPSSFLLLVVRPGAPSSFLLLPKHSMYAIYAYIGVVWGVNVGIYGIHGVSGLYE